jgi:hypothetical protein
MHGVDSPQDGGRKGSAFLLALAPIHLIADAAEDRPALGIKGFLERIRLAGKHVVRSGDPLGTRTTVDIGSRISGTHLFGTHQDPSSQ